MNYSSFYAKTMGRLSKRQKISSNPISTSLVPPTSYGDAPGTLTSYGTASSIMNGNTVEGGLKSLTYKSTNAYKLVEDLDLIKSSIIGKDSLASIIRISEKDYATSDLIKKLSAELDGLKKNSNSRNIQADEIINKLNVGLDNELLQNKSVSSQYKSQVIKSYELENKVVLNFTTDEYVIKKLTDVVPVEKFEDVKNVDLSAYERPANSKESESDITESTMQTTSIPTSELILNSGSTTAVASAADESNVLTAQTATPVEPAPSPSVPETATSASASEI